MTGFEPGVEAWRGRLGALRDRVRQDLVASQLAAHLHLVGPGGARLSVLDVGCGQGTQAIRLGRLGHDVLGIDLSEDLLRDATASLGIEEPEVRDRVTFQLGDLGALDHELHGRFDVVCCHGVVMYLDDLAEAIDHLTSALRPGGLLSVLTRNRAGLAMRAGMRADWAGAVDAFDARHYSNGVGIDGVRADDPAEVGAAFEAAGVRPIRWFGVRLFTDHWDQGDAPEDYDALVAAEQEAGSRDPFRQLAALTHTLGLRPT